MKATFEESIVVLPRLLYAVKLLTGIYTRSLGLVLIDLYLGHRV